MYECIISNETFVITLDRDNLVLILLGKEEKNQYRPVEWVESITVIDKVAQLACEWCDLVMPCGDMIIDTLSSFSLLKS